MDYETNLGRQKEELPPNNGLIRGSPEEGRGGGESFLEGIFPNSLENKVRRGSAFRHTSFGYGNTTIKVKLMLMVLVSCLEKLIVSCYELLQNHNKCIDNRQTYIDRH